MPIVLSPLLEPPPAGAETLGYTTGQYRRRVAEETGNFVASTVSTASTSFLQDTRYPVRSNLDQADLYTGKWLLRPLAPAEHDRVRVVQERGYDPGTGTLRPDSPWVSTPTTGEPYELHGVIEPWAQMLDFTNEGLKRCMVVDHLVLPVPPETTTINLTPYAPWLLDRRWVRGAAFVDPTRYDDPSQVDMTSQPTLRGNVEQHGRGLLLRWQNTPWQAQQALVVRCIRRAYDLCRASDTGVFGERSGLAAEDHESVAADDWVAAAVMTDFWNEFGDVVAAGNRAESEANQQKWAETFTSLTQQYFTLPPYTLLAPIKAGWGAANY
jgi:hypothetical protein